VAVGKQAAGSDRNRLHERDRVNADPSRRFPSRGISVFDEDRQLSVWPIAASSPVTQFNSRHRACFGAEIERAHSHADAVAVGKRVDGAMLT
jgi:hypothetical protein